MSGKLAYLLLVLAAPAAAKELDGDEDRKIVEEERVRQRIRDEEEQEKRGQEKREQDKQKKQPGGCGSAPGATRIP